MLLLKISYTALIGRSSAFFGRGQKKDRRKSFRQSFVFYGLRRAGRDGFTPGIFFFLEHYFVLASVPFSRSFRFRGRSVFAVAPFSRSFRPDIAPISRPLRHSGCMAGMPGRRRRGSDLSLLEKQGRGPVRQSPVFPGLYTNRRVST